MIFGACISNCWLSYEDCILFPWLITFALLIYSLKILSTWFSFFQTHVLWVPFLDPNLTTHHPSVVEMQHASTFGTSLLSTYYHHIMVHWSRPTLTLLGKYNCIKIWTNEAPQWYRFLIMTCDCNKLVYFRIQVIGAQMRCTSYGKAKTIFFQ